MHEVIKILLLPVLILSLASCQTATSAQKTTDNRTSQISILKTELAALNLENPESDMERNFSYGDRRFISVCGFACICPGVYKDGFNLVKQFGTRIVRGTSDMIEGEEHEHLIKLARQYAERYNKALLVKLKE